MKSLLSSFRSEVYKSRKTAAFWGAILFPLIIVLAIGIGFFLKTTHPINGNGFSHWMHFINQLLAIMGIIIVPIYSILVAYSVNNIEHSSDMWKSLFSLPVKKASLYGGKVAYAIFLLFITFLCFGLFTLIAGHLLSLAKPDIFYFDQYNITSFVFSLQLKLFLSAMGILALQFVMSIIWKDFLKPMGIGFLGLILGSLLAISKMEYVFLFPYSQPALAIFNLRMLKQDETMGVQVISNEIIASLLTATALFIFGFILISKRNIK